MIYLLWAYSYGITNDRLRLYFKDFALIPVPLTISISIEEQKKIAQILSTWDKAIEQTKNLIKAKQKLKKAITQQLFSRKVRFKEFEKEWIPRKLIDLADYYNGKAFKPCDWSKSGLPIIRIAQITNPNANKDYYKGKACLYNRYIIL